MITVTKKDKSIIISGHANNNDYGKDIVCASVSSIVYTTINAIEKIKENSIEVIDDKNMIINLLSTDEITIKLIDNMMDLLLDLQEKYPKNVKVKEN